MNTDAEILLNRLRMTTEGFIREFKQRDARRQDQPFCFILGAGASVTSGIRSADSLAKQWLDELYQDGNINGQTLEEWIASGNLGIDDFKVERKGAFYPQLYRRRFSNDPENGFACLEAEMENAVPRYGYYALAHILGTRRHKVVISTNFDNLVADALSITGGKPPLICGHESLAAYARVNLRRPLIAKIHNDLLFDPKSEPDDVSFLATPWQVALERIFKSYTPIVIGYGGNDGSLMGFLNAVRSIPGGIFWCYLKNEQPEKRIINLVSKHNGRLVAIHGFDETMRQLSEALGMSDLTNIITQRFREREDRFVKDLKSLVDEGQLARLPIEAQGSTASTSADKADPMRPKTPPLKWLMMAQFAEIPDEKEKILRAAIREYPQDGNLLGQLAAHLHEQNGDVNETKDLYQKALQADPTNQVILSNFGIFQLTVLKMPDEAEANYRRAIEHHSNYAPAYHLLASLLWDVHANQNEAEALCLRAIKQDEKNASASFVLLGNLAWHARGDLEKAEALYLTAAAASEDGPSARCNLTQLLLAQNRTGDAISNALATWSRLKHKGDSAYAETCFAVLVFAMLSEQPALSSTAIGRLKTCLAKPFYRARWNFDGILAVLRKHTPTLDVHLAEALAAAILDDSKVAELDKIEEWNEAKAIALDAMWPELEQGRRLKVERTQ